MFPGREPGRWVGELKERLYDLQLSEGFEDLRSLLMEAVRRGIITEEQVLRVLPIEKTGATVRK